MPVATSGGRLSSQLLASCLGASAKRTECRRRGCASPSFLQLFITMCIDPKSMTVWKPAYLCQCLRRASLWQAMCNVYLCASAKRTQRRRRGCASPSFLQLFITMCIDPKSMTVWKPAYLCQCLRRAILCQAHCICQPSSAAGGISEQRALTGVPALQGQLR
jgi:hypothetical protein